MLSQGSLCQNENSVTSVMESDEVVRVQQASCCRTHAQLPQHAGVCKTQGQAPVVSTLLARPQRVREAEMVRACAFSSGCCTRGKTAAFRGATAGLNLQSSTPPFHSDTHADAQSAEAAHPRATVVNSLQGSMVFVGETSVPLTQQQAQYCQSLAQHLSSSGNMRETLSD